MRSKIEQFQTITPNPVLSVLKDGTVIYSNEAGEPLLHEWSVQVGEKLPSSIVDIVQRSISLNNPEKIEIRVGKRVYLVVFHPLPEDGCVNVSGFDISEQKKIEGKLRESENKYRNVVETSFEGIWIFNAESETTYVNEKMAEMLGYNREEIIGRFIWDFAYDEDMGIFQVELANRKQGIDEVYELKLHHKDGSPLWVSVSSKGFFDDAGKFAGSVGMFTDIADRKWTEQALRESEERFRSAFDDSAIAMALVDPDARLLKVNDAFCRMLGFERSEIKGHTFHDFTYPDDLEPSILAHKEVLNGKKPFLRIEKRYIRKDGQVIWCEVSSSPVLDSKGCPIYTVAHAQDVTKRKKAEEALIKTHDNLEILVKERTTQLEKAYKSSKESEGRLSEAQRTAHLGNWDWNIVTNGLYWSDEIYRIFGRSPQEFGTTYDSFLCYVHPGDREYVNNAVIEALKGESYSIEHRIILASGEERVVHEEGEVIFNDENIPVRMVGTVQDITERKKAEEKIQSLANVVESSNDAIITISLEGIVTSWNKGAEQVYGHSAEEILGKNISIVEPDNLKGEIKRFSEKIIQGKKIQRYETLRQKKDGTLIDVSVTLSPIFDASGKLMAISAITRDITEQKRAEETLRESEARLRRFYESGLFGMLYYNLDGSIADANDRFLEIVGYTREDLQAGRINWAKMTPPEYSPLDEHAIVELKATGVTTPFEKEYIRKDGSHVSIILGVATFDQASNEGIAFVLDISERKKAEVALANIEIARKKEIHHRIKNNLQVISSLLDLQAEKFRDKEVLEAFKESKNRVLSMSLIHEELYKGEGTDTLDFSSYLQKLAKDLFQTYDFGGKNIRLCINLEENAFFNMDIAIPLGIIVNELVSNSLKHAFIGRDRGEIRIKLSREENGQSENESRSTAYVLSVADNGVGIPENIDVGDLESLGLQLVTTLVDQLDGELEMKRNEGTEFTIRFTVTEDNNQARSSASLKLVDNE